MTENDNKVSLNLSSKNIQDQSNIFGEILQSYPAIAELDLSMNGLTVLPSDLSPFVHLSSLDIRSNPFTNFEQVVSSLTTLPVLNDLKINLTDESQVKLILSQLPNLEFLNGKSTKDDSQAQNGLIDLEDDEIKNISLQNEISSFNEVYKKVAERLKSINSKDNFKEEFQNLIKGEINKINSNYETVPNYIYATNVVESQLTLYSFFGDKFLAYLEEKDPESSKICKIINDNITKSYLLLVKIIYKLYPKINEKSNFMRMQLEEALKSSNIHQPFNENGNFQENENEIKNIKEKDLLIMQLQEENQLLQTRIVNLENENKTITNKLLKNAKNIINEGLKEDGNPSPPNMLLNNNSNPNSNYATNSNIRTSPMGQYALNSQKKMKANLGNNESGYSRGLSASNSAKVINNISYCNNNMSLQSTPVCTRVFTIKMMKEVINEIYQSKTEFDKKSFENKLPRETLEQHMYTYLNQKYGLKQIIIEWASNIINGIKIFSTEDSEISLFGKILRNEIEEDSRFVYAKLRNSVSEVLTYFLKAKYPLKGTNDIMAIKKEKENGFLNEDEWKKIVNYLYETTDAKFLENKIFDVIQKKYLKNKFDVDKKLTREEIIQLTRVKDEYNIPFKDLVKILHEFQIRTREKYLKNFVVAFKRFDSDNNGIINEEEFINMIYNLNIFGNRVKENVVNLLTAIDPNNNKQITFSECVNLFSNYPFRDEKGNSKGSILDKICLEERK